MNDKIAELIQIEAEARRESFVSEFERNAAVKRGRKDGKKDARAFFDCHRPVVQRPDMRLDPKGYLASFGLDLDKINLSDDSEDLQN